MSRESSKCYDCGLPYGDPGWCDCVVPDAVWAQISPRGDEGGLLCLNCMTRRVEELGLRNVPLYIGSGPWRVFGADVPRDEINAVLRGEDAGLAAAPRNAKRRPPRCSYCGAPARHWFSYGVQGRRRGQASAAVCTVGACDEHFGCVNWNAQRQRHPDAEVHHA